MLIEHQFTNISIEEVDEIARELLDRQLTHLINQWETTHEGVFNVKLSIWTHVDLSTNELVSFGVCLGLVMSRIMRGQ